MRHAMTNTTGAPGNAVEEQRPELLLFCGLVGLIGNLTPIFTMIWAAGIAEHDFIADTISDLARGPHKHIMDVGFYVNAAGLLALSIAAAHAHLGRWAWSVGLFCLAFIALVVVLLGIWDEFGKTNDPAEGMSVHTKLTFALGPLYLAGPLLMAGGAARIRRLYRPLFLAAAGLWLVLSVAFKLAPNAYDGILEKAAIACTMLWTIPLSALFLIRGIRAIRGTVGKRPG